VCFVAKDADSAKAISIANERRLIPLKNGRERAEGRLQINIGGMTFEVYIKFY
jgi:hypothetical protein